MYTDSSELASFSAEFQTPSLDLRLTPARTFAVTRPPPLLALCCHSMRPRHHVAIRLGAKVLSSDGDFERAHFEFVAASDPQCPSRSNEAIYSTQQRCLRVFQHSGPHIVGFFKTDLRRHCKNPPRLLVGMDVSRQEEPTRTTTNTV